MMFVTYKLHKAEATDEQTSEQTNRWTSPLLKAPA